jgi:LacI family transcriptional regulator
LRRAAKRPARENRPPGGKQGKPLTPRGQPFNSGANGLGGSDLNEKLPLRRATVHDVARQAGVSLATVDRVLNGRPGVRPATAEKVESAIAALDFRRDLSASLLARARDLRVQFVLPDGRNEFMANLADAIARRARTGLAERLHLDVVRVKAMDPAALAARLAQLDRKSCDCAVIVATDDEAVRRAVDGLARKGVAVMTLVSDLPNSARKMFIGIDNVAAGRTAASLMGRFCGAGKVALIAGSLGLRDHQDRLAGFREVAAREFPQLELIGPFEAHDDRGETESFAAGLLRDHPDLKGIYNMGAGNSGLIAALESAGRAGRVRVIAHELAEPTHAGLKSGSIDVVLDQNPDGEIRAAVAGARALALGHPVDPHAEPIEIGIFLRDNLR